MKFIADLHIHSKYSRATAKNLDFENLYKAAQFKGITVVGTGDFTHPAWISEIKEKLVPAEPGLFELKKSLAAELDRQIPETCRRPVRFILQTEISNIYKKDDRVRKNHNLIYFPDIDSVERFNARLDRIGNIKSDGRPILGLDAARLLEIMLAVNDTGFLVPAHIWTPWFSMFGSKSGFDTIEECFGSLSDHIFAVETGLSSDPPMNWRIPQLDNRRLLSSSDAHSPMILGRNASVFNTKLSFAHIRNALATLDLNAYGGTLDMYPEEGKYHYDGHRKCNICLTPEETFRHGGICPECHKPLTVGVLYRVQELAQRPAGFLPENRHGFQYIIPLSDILSEICDVGPKTKKVTTAYFKAVGHLGPELDILLEKSLSEIDAAGIPLLSTAIEKMRSKNVTVDPGFDGEYGKIKLFTQNEKDALKGMSKKLFDIKDPTEKPLKKKPRILKPPGKPVQTRPVVATAMPDSKRGLLDGLNIEQKRAVLSDAGRIIIEAGPGTGKTRTLTAKIAWLLSEKKMDPQTILALTFTHKAAREIRQRIERHLPETSADVVCGTFHSFCLMILKQYRNQPFSIADDAVKKELIKEAGRQSGVSPAGMDLLISMCRQSLLTPDDGLDAVVDPDMILSLKKIWPVYESLCNALNLIDFDGLISETIHLLDTCPDILSSVQRRFSHIFIDEYQDINKGQYVLAQQISRDSRLLVIGDPDQSIYGFRGSDRKYFHRFMKENQDAEHYTLTQNYRSTQNILDASFQMITQKSSDPAKEKIYSNTRGSQKLIITGAATEQAEAVAVGKLIEKYMGGTSFFSMDAQKTDAGIQDEFSFADFAILYRTKMQCEQFANVFEKQGIPFQTADRMNPLSQKGIFELISILKLISKKAVFTNFEAILDFYGIPISATEKIRLRSHLLSNRISGTGIMNFLSERDLPFFKDSTRDGIHTVITSLKSLESDTRSLALPEILTHISEKTGIHDMIHSDKKIQETFQTLLSRAADTDMDLPVFLDTMALNQDPDHLAIGAEKVSLLTMHAAKGLEFPFVFVTGCEQDLIPYIKPGKTHSSDIDEERRLFYVAMTRAQQILCLTYAKKRRIYGNQTERNKSVFLTDIEERLKQYEKNFYRKPDGQKQAAIQMELF